MKRLSYNPKVKAYINITSPNNPDFGKTIDISDDIIDGSVQLRLDGLSTATFKLQNKNGKYLGGYVSTNNETIRGYIFTPMDKIIIAAGRITDPFQIFTGYLDEVPAFQLYPDAVTIKASSTIKLLYNTYFDPGLPYLIQYFAEQGYAYNPQTGLLSDPLSRFGNWGVYGGIGELMKNTLRDIAGWPEDQITFAEFPDAFTEGIKQATGNLQNGQAYSEGGAGVPTTTTVIASNATKNQKVGYVDIIKFMVDNGYTAEDGAAFAGNFNQESHLDPGINQNGGGPGFGLAQWEFSDSGGSGRADLLLAFAGGDRNLAATFNVQMNFVLHELKTNQSNTNRYLKDITGTGLDVVKRKAKVILDHYEVPAVVINKFSDPYEYSLELAQRQADALAAYQAWGTTGAIGNFDPKSNASLSISPLNVTPNTKPDGSGQYKAIINSNANLPDRPMQPATVAAITRIANVLKQDITITTGTNHSYDTVNGKKSEHVDGWASDIGNTYNDELIRLGRAALVAFGADPAWAETQNGGGYDIGPFKVIFNTNSSAAGGNHTDHLHVGLHLQEARDGVLPKIPGKGRGYLWNGTGPASAGGSGKIVVNPIEGVAAVSRGGSLQPSFNSETNTDFANGFVSQSLTSTDSTLSYLLTGDHALANDIPFIEWIKDLNTSSGRVFCSAPNGDFYSFFPDYFGWFNTTPYFYISDIETIDLNIQLSDQDLITHIYGIGPLIGYTQITPIDYAASPIASVQEEAFPWFIKTSTEIKPGPTGSEIWRTALQDLTYGEWDSTAFLDRYRARPKMVQFSNIRNPALLWMATWMEFMKAWAKRYHSSASFTFMPELFPGGRVNIADRIEMFVESVTHNFSYSSGFSTSASLIAPTATDAVNLDGEAERTIRSASQVSNSSPDTGDGGS